MYLFRGLEHGPALFLGWRSSGKRQPSILIQRYDNTPVLPGLLLPAPAGAASSQPERSSPTRIEDCDTSTASGQPNLVDAPFQGRPSRLKRAGFFEQPEYRKLRTARLSYLIPLSR